MSTTNLERLNEAPLADILNLLLRQFSEELAEAGLRLGDETINQLSRDLASRLASGTASALVDVLIPLVDDNLNQLNSRWNLRFPEFLAAESSQIDNWQSTAELLKLANDKIEIEQRIVIGSALLVICGRHEYAEYLLDVLEYDMGLMDLDAVIAKRALLHISGVDGARRDWLTRVRDWLRGQSGE